MIAMLLHICTINCAALWGLLGCTCFAHSSMWLWALPQCLCYVLFFCCMCSALYSCCAQASCMYCSFIFDTQYGMRPCVLDLNICHIMCMAFVCRRQSCTIHGRGIFWQRMCLDFSVSCKTLLVCTVLSAWRIIGTISHEALSILGILELAD